MMGYLSLVPLLWRAGRFAEAAHHLDRWEAESGDHRGDGVGRVVVGSSERLCNSPLLVRGDVPVVSQHVRQHDAALGKINAIVVPFRRVACDARTKCDTNGVAAASSRRA